MQRRVIGTAGHVDHGKTALVKALTGIDCDRLQEEQRRGITIALGFATWQLRPDLTASIVDVPGHERFVHTMVGGAAGLDAVILVVAADDGVMPQTVEHLQICQLLGVKKGIVAITKSDLSDEETLELVREDIAETVAGTFLETAPVIPCSSAQQTGLKSVKESVLAALSSETTLQETGPVFLPIDRLFSKPGFGTVVTGTLLNGTLRIGDEVHVVPGPKGKPLTGLRVRGLQIQETDVQEAQAGVRLAVNLRGNETASVRRGHAVVTANAFSPSTALHAEVTLLPTAPVIEERSQMALHLGTTVELVEVFPLGTKTLNPGQTHLLRLVSDSPIASFADQRLVLRQPGRHGMGTVGGGRVLDPNPATGKGSFRRWFQVAQALAGDNLEQRILALLQDTRLGGSTQHQLQHRLPPPEDIQAALEALLERQAVVAIEQAGQKRFVAAQSVASVAQKVLQVVTTFHTERPVLSGISGAEIKTQLPPLMGWLADTAIAQLTANGELNKVDNVVQLPQHKNRAQNNDALLQVTKLYQEAGLTPPLDEEMRQSIQLERNLFHDVLTELKRQNKLAKLGDNLHIAHTALKQLTSIVAQHFREQPELRPADLKRLGGGLSRKYAIPLLEWLDSEGLTIRKGDARISRK